MKHKLMIGNPITIEFLKEAIELIRQGLEENLWRGEELEYFKDKYLKYQDLLTCQYIELDNSDS